MELSGFEKLSRTLNSEEVISIGAGYIAASISGDFAVRQLITSSFVKENITIKHNEKKIVIFNEMSRINETYTYSFIASENSEIEIYSDKKLLTFSLDLPKNTTKDTRIDVVFSINPYKIPIVDEIYVNNKEIEYDLFNYKKENWTMTYSEYNRSVNIIKKMDEVLDKRNKYQIFFNDYESFIYLLKEKLDYDDVYIKVINKDDILILYL